MADEGVVAPVLGVGKERALEWATWPATARDEAFAEVYVRYFRNVSGHCAALLGDEQLGVDCAQEAFTRLFARSRGVRNPRAWVYLVATNIARDEWRRRARDRVALAELAGRPAAESGSPDSALIDEVRRLPAALGEVVLLHYFADLPIDEVARLVHRPVGTVKRRLHEARRKLQAALEGQS